ncbi:hypothetical protein MMAD_27910 [Mycolicibacterium madagascariense]|uniref:Uncharacterized protein n=1 Tax=Mycolicibacterium madagascariense TaxID=212765 RepID=A0A7I7XH28_9MYCO|nr:hypothetical protein MMAD_27910 [Mycolicibacterium madagascariense]
MVDAPAAPVDDDAEVPLGPVAGLLEVAPDKDIPLDVPDVPAAVDPASESLVDVEPFDDVLLPLPTDSPESPACVAEELASEWVVSAWATAAPESSAAPTPTLNAPAVNQPDTGSTRPPSRAAARLLC